MAPPIQHNGVPYSNVDLLAWLEDNWGIFEEHLRTARVSRRTLGARLSPPETNQLHTTRRLQPLPQRDFACIASLIRGAGHGFYCAEIKDSVLQQMEIKLSSPILFYAAFVGYDVWGLRLHQLGHRQYAIDFSIPLRRQTWPLAKMFSAVGVSDAAAISRLTVSHMESLAIDSHEVSWRVRGNSPIVEKPRGKTTENEDDCESELEDSDVHSVYSQIDSDVDEEGESSTSDKEQEPSPEEMGEQPDAADECAERADDGTWTIRTNEYFTLTNHPMYPDAKMRLKDRWCKADLLGRKDMSKALTIKDFDADESEPHMTYCLLRAWSVWRFQRGDFSSQSPFREAWLGRERDLLLKDALELGIGPPGTGNKKADKWLKRWCPELLM